MPEYKFVAISCLHAPITHEGYFDWLLDLLCEEQPDVFVNLGDWYEGLAGSRHAKDPRHNWSLMDEHRYVAAQAKALNEVLGDAHKVWLAGNHDDNAFGIHADRIPPDLREVAQWRSHSFVADELESWHIIDDYSHGRRWNLGQVSFGHGCPVTDASAKDEAYQYGVPYGLDIRGHTHRPESVTQCRERKVHLPYWYANPGTGADWDRMHYMDRQSKALWGRGAIVGTCLATGIKDGVKLYAGRKWEARLVVHSYFNPSRYGK